MVWWIASWADDDEQYKEEQPREGLFLAGAMNCWEEFSHLSLSLSAFLQLTDPDFDPSLFLGWLILDPRSLILHTLGVTSLIYRGPGPLRKY